MNELLRLLYKIAEHYIFYPPVGILATLVLIELRYFDNIGLLIIMSIVVIMIIFTWKELQVGLQITLLIIETLTLVCFSLGITLLMITITALIYLLRGSLE